MLFMLKLVLLLFLASCFGKQPIKFEDLLKPGGRLLSYMPKGGSDAYNQGWKDGCESGLSIFGHTFQKHFYQMRKDQRFYGVEFGDERDLFNGHKITKKDKDEYSAAWSATYSWCRHYMVKMQRGGSSMMPHLPGESNYYQLHGTHNIYELQSWGNTTSASGGWFANW